MTLGEGGGRRREKKKREAGDLLFVGVMQSGDPAVKRTLRYNTTTSLDMPSYHCYKVMDAPICICLSVLNIHRNDSSIVIYLAYISVAWCDVRQLCFGM